MKTYKKKTGFTLVEMLVVISIIGILMGILVPSLTKGKKNARRAECASNLRQLYMGSMSYAADENHAGHFPPAYSHEHKLKLYNVKKKVFEDIWEKNGTGWVDWRGVSDDDRYNPNDGGSVTEDKKVFWWGDYGELCIKHGGIYSYVGEDMRIYICPTFKRYVKSEGLPQFKDAKFSYVMNKNASWVSFLGAGGSKDGMSRRMLYADGAYEAKYGAAWGLKDEGDHVEGSYYYRGCDGMLEWEKERIGDWHKGKGNVVFLDGHTECLDPSRYSNGLTEKICKGDYNPGE